VIPCLVAVFALAIVMVLCSTWIRKRSDERFDELGKGIERIDSSYRYFVTSLGNKGKPNGRME
jgi:hypothetical protein